MSGIGPISETPTEPDLWIGPIDPRLGSLAAAVGANTAYLSAFTVSRSVTVSKAGVLVGAATGGNMDLGIYDAAGNRLASTGATAVGTVSTYQEVALTAPVSLVPGQVYWAALAASSASPTFYGLTTALAGGMVGLTATATANSGVLPATISLATPVARNFSVRFVV